jgi:hypothetical protein
MMKCFILLSLLCLLVIDASRIVPIRTKKIPDLLSACARMDIWGLSEVAKLACGAACCYKNCAVGTCIKSGGRPVCSCSRYAPGAGGGIGCAISGKK